MGMQRTPEQIMQEVEKTAKRINPNSTFVKPTSYFKNLAASVKSMSSDYLGTSAPNIKTGIDAVKEFRKESTQFFRDNKLMRQVGDRKDGIAKETRNMVTNAMKDIASGDIAGKKRMGALNKELDDDFDFSFDEDEDFSFDDDDNDSFEDDGDTIVQKNNYQVNITKSDSGAIMSAAKAQADVSANISARSEVFSEKRHIELTNIASQQLQYLSEIAHVQKESMSPMAADVRAMSEKLVASMEDTTALMREVSGNTGRANAIAIWKESKGEEEIVERSPFEDKFQETTGYDIGGVKNRAQNLVKGSELYGMFEMLTDRSLGPSAIDQLINAPLGTILPMLIPSAIDDVVKTTNSVIGGALPRMVMNASEWGKEKGGIWEQLAGVLGYESMDLSGVDLKVENKEVPWDFNNSRTLNEVIPGYLADILSALTGDPARIYDHQTGRYTTRAKAREEMDAYRNDAFKSAFSLDALATSFSMDEEVAQRLGIDIRSGDTRKLIKTGLGNVARKGLNLDSVTRKVNDKDTSYIESLMEDYDGPLDRNEAARQFSGILSLMSTGDYNDIASSILYGREKANKKHGQLKNELMESGLGTVYALDDLEDIKAEANLPGRGGRAVPGTATLGTIADILREGILVYNYKDKSFKQKLLSRQSGPGGMLGGGVESASPEEKLTESVDELKEAIDTRSAQEKRKEEAEKLQEHSMAFQDWAKDKGRGIGEYLKTSYGEAKKAFALGDDDSRSLFQRAKDGLGKFRLKNEDELLNPHKQNFDAGGVVLGHGGSDNVNIKAAGGEVVLSHKDLIRLASKLGWKERFGSVKDDILSAGAYIRRLATRPGNKKDQSELESIGQVTPEAIANAEAFFEEQNAANGVNTPTGKKENVFDKIGSSMRGGVNKSLGYMHNLEMTKREGGMKAVRSQLSSDMKNLGSKAKEKGKEFWGKAKDYGKGYGKALIEDGPRGMVNAMMFGMNDEEGNKIRKGVFDKILEGAKSIGKKAKNIWDKAFIGEKKEVKGEDGKTHVTYEGGFLSPLMTFGYDAKEWLHEKFLGEDGLLPKLTNKAMDTMDKIFGVADDTEGATISDKIRNRLFGKEDEKFGGIFGNLKRNTLYLSKRMFGEVLGYKDLNGDGKRAGGLLQFLRDDIGKASWEDMKNIFGGEYQNKYGEKLSSKVRGRSKGGINLDTFKQKGGELAEQAGPTAAYVAVNLQHTLMDNLVKPAQSIQREFGKFAESVLSEVKILTKNTVKAGRRWLFRGINGLSKMLGGALSNTVIGKGVRRASDAVYGASRMIGGAGRRTALAMGRFSVRAGTKTRADQIKDELNDQYGLNKGKNERNEKLGTLKDKLDKIDMDALTTEERKKVKEARKASNTYDRMREIEKMDAKGRKAYDAKAKMNAAIQDGLASDAKSDYAKYVNSMTKAGKGDDILKLEDWGTKGPGKKYSDLWDEDKINSTLSTDRLREKMKRTNVNALIDGELDKMEDKSREMASKNAVLDENKKQTSFLDKIKEGVNKLVAKVTGEKVEGVEMTPEKVIGEPEKSTNPVKNIKFMSEDDIASGVKPEDIGSADAQKMEALQEEADEQNQTFRSNIASMAGNLKEAYGKKGFMRMGMAALDGVKGFFKGIGKFLKMIPVILAGLGLGNMLEHFMSGNAEGGLEAGGGLVSSMTKFSGKFRSVAGKAIKGLGGGIGRGASAIGNRVMKSGGFIGKAARGIAGSKPAQLLKKGLDFVFNSKLLKKFPGAKRVALELGEKAIKKGAPKILTRFATKTAANIASGGVAIAATVGMDYLAGRKNAANYFQVGPGMKLTGSMKNAAGIANAISGFTYGLVPADLLVNPIFDKIGSDEDKQAVSNSREELNAMAQQYGVEAGDLNDITNRTMGGKFLDAVRTRRRETEKNMKKLGMTDKEEYYALMRDNAEKSLRKEAEAKGWSEEKLQRKLDKANKRYSENGDLPWHTRLGNGFKKIITDIKDWFTEKVGKPISNFFKNIWKSVTGFFKDKFVNPLKAGFSKLVNWGKEKLEKIGLLEPITKVFDYVNERIEKIGALFGGILDKLNPFKKDKDDTSEDKERKGFLSRIFGRKDEAAEVIDEEPKTAFEAGDRSGAAILESAAGTAGATIIPFPTPEAKPVDVPVREAPVVRNETSVSITDPSEDVERVSAMRTALAAETAGVEAAAAARRVTEEASVVPLAPEVVQQALPVLVQGISTLIDINAKMAGFLAKIAAGTPGRASGTPALDSETRDEITDIARYASKLASGM
jgi:hypothetical protein